MFSHRLPDNLDPNEFSKLLARKRAEGARLLDLTESNPTKAGIPYPNEEILAALHDPRALTYEPTPRGLRSAREAVAKYYADRGQTVHPDQILLTASTSEAYAYLFKLFADPGESFLVPTPSYPLFDMLAGLEDVALVPYPLHYAESRGWRLDPDAFEGAIVPSARGVILVNPNNPTGSCLRRSEWVAVRQAASREDLAVVCDEVFSDYLWDETLADPDVVRSIAGDDSVLSFSLSGLSKVCGLPQMKLGWIVVNGPPAGRTEVMRRLELIADTYLSVAAPVQHAAARLLGTRGPIQVAIRERVAFNHKRLQDLRRRCGGADLQVLASDGGWYALLQLPGPETDEAQTQRWLNEIDVLAHPGFFFGVEDREVAVLSLLTPVNDFDRAMRKLGQFWTGMEC
ncbi:MAG: pyridoxal phosphate-dependent aminotransferase [Planctomycetota bacterium]